MNRYLKNELNFRYWVLGSFRLGTPSAISIAANIPISDILLSIFTTFIRKLEDTLASRGKVLN